MGSEMCIRDSLVGNIRCAESRTDKHEVDTDMSGVNIPNITSNYSAHSNSVLSVSEDENSGKINDVWNYRGAKYHIHVLWNSEGNTDRFCAHNSNNNTGVALPIREPRRS